MKNIKILFLCNLQTVFLVLVVGLEMITNNSSLVRKCLDFGNFLLTYTPRFCLILFCFLGRFVSLQLEAIQSSLKFEIDDQQQFLPCQLNILKNQYLLVFDQLSEINRHFGPYLMIETSFIFIGVINASLYLATSIMGGDNFLGIMCSFILIDHIIRMALITSCSENIQNQVKKT